MQSSPATANTNALASQYNSLRNDAYGGSMLHAHQQASPGLTLYVEPGTGFCNGVRVAFAGGSSPSFTAPVSNPRVDILVMDSSGNLTIVQGTEAGSPVPPTYPLDKVVVCEVWNVVGETIIFDNANQTAGQGYVLNDVRPFNRAPRMVFNDGSISASNSSGTVTGLTFTQSGIFAEALVINATIEIIDNGTVYHWPGVSLVNHPFTLYIPRDVLSLNIQLQGVIYVENGSSVINPVTYTVNYSAAGVLTIVILGPAVSTGTHSYQMFGSYFLIG